MKNLSRIFSLATTISLIALICLLAHAGSHVMATNQTQQRVGELGADLSVNLDELDRRTEIINIESGQRLSLDINIESKKKDNEFIEEINDILICYTKKINVNPNPLVAATDINFGIKIHDTSARDIDIYFLNYLLRTNSAYDILIIPGTAYYVNETAGVTIPLADLTTTDDYFSLDTLVIEIINRYRHVDLGAVHVDIICYQTEAAHLMTLAGKHDGAYGSEQYSTNYISADFNDTLIFNVDVYNIGQKNITGAYLNVELPEGVTYQSGTTRIFDRPWNDSLSGGSLPLPDLSAGIVYNIQFIAEVNLPVASYERVLPTDIKLLFGQGNEINNHFGIQIIPDELYVKIANYQTNIPLLLSIYAALMSMIGVFGPRFIDINAEGIKRYKANKTLLFIGLGLFILLVVLSLPLLFSGMLSILPWSLIAR